MTAPTPQSPTTTTRVCVVTGGGSGIGAAITEKFCREGYTAVIVGRRTEVLDLRCGALVEQGYAATAIQGDVSIADDCDRVINSVVARYGRLDVLVSNAGIAVERDFLNLDEAEWDHVLDVNLKGAFLISQRVARALVRLGQPGSIVHIGSIDAFGAERGYSSYHVSKAGLQALVRSSAVELASMGIRVNSVCPGYVESDMAPKSRALTDYLRTTFARVPRRRLTGADEVAQAVYFLASEAASGITGTSLVVDGGLLADLFVRESFPAPLLAPALCE